jgi:hypothetical protein
VDKLPDFSKVCFPNLDPLPLALVLPQAHRDDLAFLESILQMDPNKRLSAAQVLHTRETGPTNTTSSALSFHSAASSNYFLQTPLPASTGEIVVPLRKSCAHLSGGVSGGGKSEKPIDSVEGFHAIVDAYNFG